MTALNIYTVAGGNGFGYGGDGGPATAAAVLSHGRVGGQRRQPPHRRLCQQRNPRPRRDHGHLLRPGDDGREHLHRRRRERSRLLGQRGAGDRRAALRSPRRDRPWHERHHHRRLRQQHRPVGGRRRHHLPTRRRCDRRLLGRRWGVSLSRAERPHKRCGRRRPQPRDRRHWQPPRAVSSPCPPAPSTGSR